MKVISFLFILPTILANTPFLDKFENWINEFRIQFQSKTHFYDVLKKWIINDQYIDIINNENKSYQLGHNQFSGMDEFEFIQYVIKNPIIQSSRYQLPIPPLSVEFENTTLDNPPLSVDWVSAGAVSPVKDQGQCGSCWSFSTTGALEGIYYIKTGKLIPFSEQQLVDCDTLKNGGRDHGCNGGLMDNAFAWISKNGGLCSEDVYPYISGDGTTEACKKDCENVPKSKIQTWVDVEPTDMALMGAIAQQPVSIAIEADQRDFQLYKSGVFTGKCGTTLDHGVLVVGYGTEENQDYYLVKNSWGITWGLGGYIKLGRGPQYNNGQGQCGILLEASYPVL